MPENTQVIILEAVRLLLNIAIFSGLAYFLVKRLQKLTSPDMEHKVKAQKAGEKILDRIGMKNLELSEYELIIASQLVDSSAVKVSWDDIAGLEAVIEEIRETVILPIQNRRQFSASSLIQPPKGVLLYGPPGCGKTMIAKATAKEAGVCFLNVDVSAIKNKWFGESEKFASAVFTLAIKIQPCIIFIDEIDCFLRARSMLNNEMTASLKAQFMILWDGLITDPDCQVVLMGATNRPQDIDGAILRRMPAKFHIDLPNLAQRCSILKRVLQNEDIAEDVDMAELAWHTDGFSGSDLRELCRNAALCKVRQQWKNGANADGELDQDSQRSISMSDFLDTLDRKQNYKIHKITPIVPNYFLKNTIPVKKPQLSGHN